jgi:aspartate oxidase
MEGVQFHPESVLTPEGPHLVANFLRLAGEGEAALLDAAGGSFATHGLAEADEDEPADGVPADGVPAGPPMAAPAGPPMAGGAR